MSTRTETAFAVTLAAGAAILAFATPQLTGGGGAGLAYYLRSAFFPWVALGLVVVFGGWTAFQAWRGTGRDLSDEIDAANTSVLKALGGAAILGLYILLSMAIGYAVATFVSLCLLGFSVGIRTRTVVLLALALTVVLYALFVFGFGVWFAPSWLQGWSV